MNLWGKPILRASNIHIIPHISTNAPPQQRGACFESKYYGKQLAEEKSPISPTSGHHRTPIGWSHPGWGGVSNPSHGEIPGYLSVAMRGTQIPHLWREAFKTLWEKVNWNHLGMGLKFGPAENRKGFMIQHKDPTSVGWWSWCLWSFDPSPCLIVHPSITQCIRNHLDPTYTSMCIPFLLPWFIILCISSEAFNPIYPPHEDGTP